jgi:hypothetical protein
VQIATDYGFAVFASRRRWCWRCDVEEDASPKGLAALRDPSRVRGDRIAHHRHHLQRAPGRGAPEDGDVAAAEQVVKRCARPRGRTGGRAYEAELHRVQGNASACMARTRSQGRGGACSSRRSRSPQGARASVRARDEPVPTSWRAARERLAQLVDRFETEDDCADLQAARTLLTR